MAMHREGFSEFLHQRRIALGKRWKQILSDAYLSRATLHRLRNGDPHHPIAEADSLRALSHSLGFGSWDELMEAYAAKNPRTGLDRMRPSETPRPPDSAPLRGGRDADDDAVIVLSNALKLSPTEMFRRLGVRGAAGTGFGAGNRDLPSALRSNLKRSARMVPHFSSGVAAVKPRVFGGSCPRLT